MIICNSRRYVFVHLHKTAGTAVTRELEQSLSWNDLSIAGTGEGNANEAWFRKRFGLEMHAGAQTIRDVLGEQIWNEYFTFAIVRNPYRRILSLYTWLDTIYRDRGLKRLLRFVRPDRGIWAWPGMQAYLETADFSSFLYHPALVNGAPGARPMSDSLCDGGRLLVDFVGRMEDFDADFATIRERIGLPIVTTERTNASSNLRDLGQYYRSQKDLDEVYNRFVQDFEMFGYEKLLWKSSGVVPEQMGR